ncbi:MAG: alpha/beta fold hydrolase, partial [Candidatus Hodarchaeota archaeon]
LVLISSMARTPNFILKAIKLLPPPVMWRPLKSQAIKRAPEFLFASNTDPKTVKEFIETGLKTPDFVLAASAKGIFLNFDLYDQLADFSVPTLLLRGKQDPFCTTEVFEDLKTIKYSKAIEIDQTSHMLPIEAPKVVIGHIQEFLSKKFPTS